MIFHPRHIIQSIEKAVLSIDKWAKTTPTRSDFDNRITRTVDRIVDTIANRVFTIESFLDELTSCPRCHNTWTVIDMKYELLQCGACSIQYIPQTGIVTRACHKDNVFIRWNIDKHTVEVFYALRPAIIVPWIPYDYKQKDLEKYLVLI